MCQCSPGRLCSLLCNFSKACMFLLVKCDQTEWMCRLIFFCLLYVYDTMCSIRKGSICHLYVIKAQICGPCFVCFIRAYMLKSSCNGVLMWQGAQCSLLECCLTLKYHTSDVWHDIPFSCIKPTPGQWVLTLSCTFLCQMPRERATSSILKVFGMIWPEIEAKRMLEQMCQYLQKRWIKYNVLTNGDV